MAKPSLDSLQTPANGQIFSLSGALSKSAVDAAFRAAAAKSSQRTVVKEIRQKRNTNGTEYLASLVSFPLSSTPSFFPKSNLKENTYGFLLLLEVQAQGNWFLGIFRHAASNLNEWLDDRSQPLPRTKLAAAFGQGTTLKKLSVQRMTASKQELRGASYEGYDLQTSLPLMAASRCALRSLRFDHAVKGSFSVTINTSRVQHAGSRSGVDELAEMVITVVNATLQAKRNEFLVTFAQTIPLSELPAGAVPNSVLFDWSDLLEGDELELQRSARSSGLKRDFSKGLLTRTMGETLLLLPEGKGWKISNASKKDLGLIVPTTNKYSVRGLLGDRLFVHNTRTSETVPLSRWVRENDACSITFTQPEYFFGSGALYHRGDFNREVKTVRRCLQVETALSKATSEKGKAKVKDTRFPGGSIFRVVEDSIYAKAQWLCCLDLGDEWADYVCVRDNRLIFAHCKGGKTTVGASSFQEVVGQGLKNLGRAQATAANFQAKLMATAKKNHWGRTQIERLRGAGTGWAGFQSAMATLMSNPDSTREVHLVVTMLSLTDFDNVKKKTQPPPHFIQLVWLLASFINSCREMGAKPLIVCKP